MDAGSKCIKYMIFIVNLVFVLGGLALVGFGSALLFKLNGGMNIVKELAPSSAWIIIVLGLVVFSVAFLGCCGAIQESRCLLVIFAIVLTLLFLVKFSTGAVVLANPGLVQNYTTTQITIQFKKGVTQQTEMIEKSLNCCGLDGPQFYNNSTLPASCCGDTATACPSTKLPGCLEKAKNFLKEYGKVFAFVSIGIGIVEGLGVLFVAMLICSISSSNNGKLRF